jgi:hypothetical protein
LNSGRQKEALVQRHLERSLVLNDVSEFKNLYAWSVSEVAEASERAATKQIPFAWTLYFTLFDIKLVSSVSQDRYSSLEDKAPTVVQKSHVLAKLRAVHSSDAGRSIRYSMFGTDRTIEEITLSIYPNSAAEFEGCSAFGGISYTHDVDFRDETYPDYLGFTLCLPKEVFAQIASKIEQRALGGGTFRVAGVKGFYSDWSPSISPDNIKVLTSNEKEHHVRTPEGCEIVPPRLGKVDGFDLTLWSDRISQGIGTTHISEEIENAATQGHGGDSALNSPLTDPSVVAPLKSLRLAAWIIAALLLILVFK